MKNVTTSILLAFVMIANVFQLSAQIGGLAAKPVISTSEKPVYFFVESAADGTVTMGSGTATYLGNLLYVPESTHGVNLKHDPVEIISSTVGVDNALWQLVLEDDVVKLKNKGSGLYMKDCRFAFDSTAFAFVATAFDEAPDQYKIRTTDQASYAVAWYSSATGNYIDRWSSSTANSQIAWYFIVEEGSQANYDEMFLLTIKRELAEKIANAQGVIENSSLGNDPGQFSLDSQEELLGVIELAQMVHDFETSLEALESAMVELDNAVDVFLSTVILPVISDDNNSKWYFLQGTRPANTYMTFIGEEQNILSRTVIPDDTQLWKFVENTQGAGAGLAMINKASGLYMNADAIYNTAVTATGIMPVNKLRFIASDIFTDKRARFWIENESGSEPMFRLHSGNASIMNWNGNAYDNSSWLILDYNVALGKFLDESIVKAQDLLENTVEGSEFGQFSPESRTALGTVISVELARDRSVMNEEDFIASNQTLKDAVAAYACVNDVSKLSSVVERKWFRLINNMSGTGYASNKAMTSNGRTLGQKFTFEVADSITDDQLFCLELNESGTAVISIRNKATGYYVGADGMVVEAAPETEFSIVAIDNISFEIIPNGNASLHAAYSNSDILNWEAGAGSASSWRFEFVSTEEITEFTDAYLAKRVSARSRIEEAKPFVGSEFGRYTTSSVAAIEGVVEVEEAKEIANMTQEEMKNGIFAINAALTSGFIVNTDMNLLESASPDSFKWFRIICAQSGPGYAAGKAMSSNGRMVGEQFTYEEVDPASDSQLFRFVLSENDSLVAHIINKAEGYYINVSGAVDIASTDSNMFDIVQLAGGRSFLIDPTMNESDPLHTQEAGANIVNWLSGVGSASAWFIEAIPTEPNEVKNLLSDKYRVRTLNRRIFIEGFEVFEIYSYSGRKLSHDSALLPGIYIVKVNSDVLKVVMK
ncbi:MAG: hypothetical protein JXR27_11150 [Paludibacteraceae bacterium]|nr:hypothetical protein [Paludibacteraceae bacterium]